MNSVTKYDMKKAMGHALDHLRFNAQIVASQSDLLDNERAAIIKEKMIQVQGIAQGIRNMIEEIKENK